MDKLMRFIVQNNRWLWPAYIVLLVALYCALIVLFQPNFMLLFFLYIVCSVAGSLAISLSALALLRRAEAALHSACDPEPLLLEARAQRKTMRNKQYQKTLLASEGAALCEMARAGEAIALLEPLARERASLRPAPLFTVYHNLCLALLLRGETGEAARYHERAGGVLPACKKEKNYPALSLAHVYGQLAVDFARGETDGLAARIERFLSDAPCESARVSARWLLARVLLQQNRPGDARAHLQYVIDHGNKLPAREKARAALAQMESACKP